MAINLHLSLGQPRLGHSHYSPSLTCYCLSVITCQGGCPVSFTVRANQVTAQNYLVLLLVMTQNCAGSTCTNLVGLRRGDVKRPRKSRKAKDNHSNK